MFSGCYKYSYSANAGRIHKNSDSLEDPDPDPISTVHGIHKRHSSGIFCMHVQHN